MNVSRTGCYLTNEARVDGPARISFERVEDSASPHLILEKSGQVLPGRRGPGDKGCAIRFGTLLALALLTVGILSTIEKARAMHYRRGFLSALSVHLLKGAAPPGYLGWSALRSIRILCGPYEKSGQCCRHRDYMAAKNSPKKDSPSTAPQWKRCWDLGAEEATVLQHKRILPGMLESFMSLSGMLYSAAYGLVVAIALACTAVLMHRE
ncbi:MAG: hypothetical protein BIFFINMI_02798 [Phycisphaerae bacterium]|nr:hypothetical protein [Phycisphaerae bacterium]